MIVLIVEIVIVILGFLSSFYLFFKKPYLSMAASDQLTTKKLSVIIPCRNEEKNIALLLGDLLSQTVKPHEIIVVDDGSTDNTFKVANSFPVKVVSIQDKDPEYIGKSWAVETGSKHATGELLLFLDADVRLSKNALSRVLCLKEINENKIITIQPYHQTEKCYEQFSMPFNLIQFAANKVGTPSGKPFALYGPFVLISAEIYNSIGRHYHVRQSIIEDVSLGIYLRQNGYDFSAYLGKEDIRYRMYSDGFASLTQGWIKNISFGASKTSGFITLLVFFLIASILGSVTGFITALIQRNILFITLFALCSILWFVRLQFLCKPIGKFRFSSYLFYPVIFLMFLYLFTVSIYKKWFKAPIKWKNRIIQ